MKQYIPVVLFVCVHNTARSQMAERLLRHYGRNREGEKIVEVISCGTKPAERTNEIAVSVMNEIHVDLGTPKIQRKEIGPVDYIISLCEMDAGECTVESRDDAVHVSWQVGDPAQIGDPAQTFADAEEKKIEAFRKTRDRLEERVKGFLNLLLSDRWAEMDREVRTNALLEIHARQLTFELLDSLETVSADKKQRNVSTMTLKELVLELNVSELWKVGMALAGLVTAAFGAGWFLGAP